MLKNFKYRYEKVEDYTQYIEEIFEEIGYEYPVDYKCHGKYYTAFNPLIDDNNSRSCQIYKKDGILLMYNGVIEVERKGNKVMSNSITPSEYARILNKFDIYIDFIIHYFRIDFETLKEYREELCDNMLNGKSITWNKKFGFDHLRRLFFDNYITDRDILLYKNINKSLRYLSRIFKKEPKQIFEDVKINLIEPLEINKKIIHNYCKNRKIDFIENKVYPVVATMYDNKYYENGVCFCYPNGFKKIRFIRTDNHMRYLAYTKDGQYDCFFEVKNDKKTKICFLVEGEIEGLTIDNFIEDDIYCMHNTNSLPNNLQQLSFYEKVIVKIDYSDRFNQLAQSLKEKLSILNKEIIIAPKFISENKKIDYNYMYVNNRLTKDMIYDTIYIDKNEIIEV